MSAQLLRWSKSKPGGYTPPPPPPTSPYVRQWFCTPNTGSLFPASVSARIGDLTLSGGGTRGATLAGSTLVVIPTYSYDVQAAASVTDSKNQNWPDIVRIADPTAAVVGHQWLQANVVQNSLALGVNDTISIATLTDYTGFLFLEITNVGAQSLLGFNALYQPNVAGGLNNINSGVLPAAVGAVLIVSTSTQTTGSGAAPYAPTAGSGAAFGGNWFANPNATPANAVIGTWETLSLNNPAATTPTFNAPSGSPANNYISIGLMFGTASVVTPPSSAAMALISRGVPAFSSTGTASAANDADYNTAWNSTASTGTLTYDLSSVASANRQQIMLSWYNDNTYEYDHSQYPTGQLGYNNLGSYTVQVNAAAGGTGVPPTTGWVNATPVTGAASPTVSGNTAHSRTHVINFTGYNWVRLNVSASDGTTGNFNLQCNCDVWNATNGVTDGWIFIGDSITANCMGHQNFATVNCDSFTNLTAAINGNYPSQEVWGQSGWATADWVSYLGTALPRSPAKYAVIALGSNDAYGNVPASTYYTNLNSLVQSCIAAGKTVYLPTIPWSNVAHGGPSTTFTTQYNTQIANIIAANPGNVFAGPDFYTYFSANQGQINSTDGVHPTDAGAAHYRGAWAQIAGALPGLTQPGTKAALVAYLGGLANGSSNRMLVGEHLRLFSGSSTAIARTYWDQLITATGKTPAIMGTLLVTDQILGVPGANGSALNAQINAQQFQQHTAAGGLVQLSWYTPNPVYNVKQGWPPTSYGPITAAQFKQVTTPGNAVYTNYQNYMASAVATLKSAPYVNVPCLWRPFIELTYAGTQPGDNWYSGQNSADFVTLWLMTYNYFVNAGVTWLLWVWNLNNYPPIANNQYWPGSAYVDVVSTDPYPNPETAANISGSINFTWPQLINKGKPIIFSEVGYNGSGSNDNLLWLNTLKANFPQSVGYVVFSDQWAIIQGANAKALMTDPWSITLDKLPAGLV